MIFISLRVGAEWKILWGVFRTVICLLCPSFRKYAWGKRGVLQILRLFLGQTTLFVAVFAHISLAKERSQSRFFRYLVVSTPSADISITSPITLPTRPLTSHFRFNDAPCGFLYAIGTLLFLALGFALIGWLGGWLRVQPWVQPLVLWLESSWGDQRCLL